MTRRWVLALVLAVVAGGAARSVAQRPVREALWCYGASVDGGADTRLPIPADNPANIGWITESRLFNQHLGVQASLRYNPFLRNALADPQTNEVVLGLPLLREAESKGPVAVNMGMGFIMAHEYGHIFQFKMVKQDLSRLTKTPVVELQADVLGAYWAGARLAQQRRDLGQGPEWIDQNAAESVRQAQNLGDFAFTSRHHHGTPNQRRKAAQTGMKAGVDERFGNVDSAYSRSQKPLFDWSWSQAEAIFNGPK